MIVFFWGKEWFDDEIFKSNYGNMYKCNERFSLFYFILVVLIILKSVKFIVVFLVEG